MAGMVVGGLFNAFAFEGAEFLFSKLNHSGYKDEIKRHNLALEQLSVAKQKWYEKEVARKNDIETKRHQLVNANMDIKITNKALLDLSRYSEVSEARSESNKPSLNDYYKPSKEMEEYQTLTMTVVGLGSGLAGYKVYTMVQKKRSK